MIASQPGREDRKWYYLGLRHLRMSIRLLKSGFADGAVFHAYHAYECLLSAFIAAKGYPVPPEGWTSLRLPSGTTVRAYPSPLGMIQDHNAHKARLVFFDQLADRTAAYYSAHRLLRTFFTYQDRLDALYYDPALDQLPEEQFAASFAAELLPTVWRFAREVRTEIP
jgi:hypothetical protein